MFPYKTSLTWQESSNNKDITSSNGAGNARATTHSLHMIVYYDQHIKKHMSLVLCYICILYVGYLDISDVFNIYSCIRRL